MGDLDNEGPLTIAKVKITDFAPTCYAFIGGCKAQVLVDTGCQITLISEEFYEKICSQCHYELLPNSLKLISVTGSSLKNIGSIRTTIQFAKFRRQYTFCVIKYLQYDCILGFDFINEFNVKLDFGRKSLIIDNNVILLQPKYEKQKCFIVRLCRRVLLKPKALTRIASFVNSNKVPNKLVFVFIYMVQNLQSIQTINP